MRNKRTYAEEFCSQSFHVSLGAHDWTARHVSYSRVANISLHPRFHWRGLRVHHLPEYDLAILTLAQDTRFSASVRPVCLPAARSWKDYSGVYSEVSHYKAMHNLGVHKNITSTVFGSTEMVLT